MTKNNIKFVFIINSYVIIIINILPLFAKKNLKKIYTIHVHRAENPEKALKDFKVKGRASLKGEIKAKNQNSGRKGKKNKIGNGKNTNPDEFENIENDTYTSSFNTIEAETDISSYSDINSHLNNSNTILLNSTDTILLSDLDSDYNSSLEENNNNKTENISIINKDIDSISYKNINHS